MSKKKDANKDANNKEEEDACVNLKESSGKYENGLFIFRRDFRVVDNIGLNLANDKCKRIYAVFIFTPEQVGSGNSYKSDNAVQFMIESLQDLASNIRRLGGELYCFYGKNVSVVSELIRVLNIDCVCFNADYTPYAIDRELSIIRLCDSKDVAVEYGHDYYLHAPGSILNGAGHAYQKFTPYYNAALRKKVDAPTGPRKIHFATTTKHLSNRITLSSALGRFIKRPNENILVKGGRPNAIKQLRIAAKNISHYSQTRDELSKPTSQLSAFIKFGCVSVREVYKLFRNNRAFTRQLVFRDFYMNVLYAFPHVLGSGMNRKYNKIRWHHNENWFQKWTKGETGFPIVDAGMRQMNQCGYMHNRARMIVSSFLIKTLLISWQKGEKYFAEKLTDYDPASNNAGWQWSSGSGTDSQPYWRVFNPWTQSKEHDKQCEYIKQWVPELYSLDPKVIHNWDTEWVNHKDVKYPKPICNYEEQKDKALAMYKAALY
jgi:deoxyribodipyrimidine photo-lyase